jgi:hypothetical protein
MSAAESGIAWALLREREMSSRICGAIDTRVLASGLPIRFNVPNCAGWIPHLVQI